MSSLLIFSVILLVFGTSPFSFVGFQKQTKRSEGVFVLFSSFMRHHAFVRLQNNRLKHSTFNMHAIIKAELLFEKPFEFINFYVLCERNLTRVHSFFFRCQSFFFTIYFSLSRVCVPPCVCRHVCLCVYVCLRVFTSSKCS